MLKRSAETFVGPKCGKAETFPSWVVWSKRLANPARSVAVLAINLADTPQSLSVTYDDLIGAGAGDDAALVGTDVWTGEPTVKVTRGQPWHVELPDAHGSHFLLFSTAGSRVV